MTACPWILRFDGLYEPRYRTDGIATYGFVVEHAGAVVHEERGLVAPPESGASGNVAEFAALIRGLTWLRNHADEIGECPMHVEGDSRLAIETVAGRWRLSSEHLQPLRDLAQRLVADLAGGRLGSVRLEKVSREANAEADRLSREAYHEAAAEHPEWGLGKWSKSASRGGSNA